MTKQPESSLLWLKKAYNDLKAGKDEFSTNEPATDTICFHMQQAVEKFLKAYIIFCGHEVEKTHNISRILDKCRSIDTDFSVLADTGIENLTPYGTVVRYPEDFYMPTLDETKEAIMLAEKVKSFIEDKLTGLSLDINLDRT